MRCLYGTSGAGLGDTHTCVTCALSADLFCSPTGDTGQTYYGGMGGRAGMPGRPHLPAATGCLPPPLLPLITTVGVGPGFCSAGDVACGWLEFFLTLCDCLGLWNFVFSTRGTGGLCVGRDMMVVR
jgi:hypothetical protein